MVNSVQKTFSNDELIERAFYRVAWNIRHMWEATGTSDTRLFLEPIIPSSFVLVGQSKGGNATYNEHVVPRIILREQCHDMLRLDSSEESLSNIALFIRRFLKIVKITKDEQVRLDVDLGLKQKMPDGWTFDTGDVFARLDVAGINYDFL